VPWPAQRSHCPRVSVTEKILEQPPKKRTVALPVVSGLGSAPQDIFLLIVVSRVEVKMSGECQPAPERPAEAAQRTVLVVEDEVVLRMAVSAHLRESGFVVVEAVSADEAVELLSANHSIELVFSDIMMPGKMDGDQLAAWIGERYPEMLVLLTSCVGQSGQMPFIAKPYSFLELQHRIEQMLPDDADD
jgi:CheY-like chemotaxis protein